MKSDCCSAGIITKVIAKHFHQDICSKCQMGIRYALRFPKSNSKTAVFQDYQNRLWFFDHFVSNQTHLNEFLLMKDIYLGQVFKLVETIQLRYGSEISTGAYEQFQKDYQNKVG